MKAVVISTWKHGINANEVAYKILSEGGNSLDAVEYGVKEAENDPSVLSVVYGGLPDADGRVTLDSAIMDWKARVGSVICIENIKNPDLITETRFVPFLSNKLVCLIPASAKSKKASMEP